MSDAGIGVGVHYRSLAQQAYYQDRFAWRPDDYPVSTAFGNNTVSLPLGPSLEDADIRRITGAVSAILAK